MKHVEMEQVDGETLSGPSFCGVTVGQDDVSANDWFVTPEVIQAATCPECLLKIFMLGDHATIALARMGMKVEARNEVPGD